MSNVDVVVPCYNYAHFLPRCVDSILGQSGVDLRVLIVDDASTDETPAVGERLQTQDPRVEFRRHASNRGHIATYNEGLLDWARADYSLLISADDLLAPGALARAAQLMDRHPRVVMTYGMCLIIDDADLALPPALPSDETLVLPGRRFVKKVFDETNVVPTPTAIVRTGLQQQLGGYKAHLPHSADMELWLRFAMHGDVGVIRATQAYYRRHAGSMSARYYARAVSDRRERLATYDEVIAGYGAGDAQLKAWRDQAAHRLAENALWLAAEALQAGDRDGCADCVAFAVEASPGVRASPLWRSLRFKRLLGPALSRATSRLADRLRGRATADTDTPVVQIGWWPESQSA